HRPRAVRRGARRPRQPGVPDRRPLDRAAARRGGAGRGHRPGGVPLARARRAPRRPPRPPRRGPRPAGRAPGARRRPAGGPRRRHPTFADLPGEEPLAEWDTERLVTPVRGIHRHVVRFVAYGPQLYALKELPGRLAEREYRLLRGLAERSVPVVEAVGVATGRTTREGEPLDDVLITEHLRYSLPYRALFSRRSLSDLWEPLLDALAQLLVRAHLAGFFWGDCSLSNTLFRRDAGALAAYIVDVETGEM